MRFSSTLFFYPSQPTSERPHQAAPKSRLYAGALSRVGYSNEVTKSLPASCRRTPSLWPSAPCESPDRKGVIHGKTILLMVSPRLSRLREGWPDQIHPWPGQDTESAGLAMGQLRMPSGHAAAVGDVEQRILIALRSVRCSTTVAPNLAMFAIADRQTNPLSPTILVTLRPIGAGWLLHSSL